MAAQTFPCSYAQQRMWFLDRLSPGRGLYNIPAAVHLERGVDAQVLEQSMNELVRRHETLRTTFRDVEGEPQQVVAEEQALKVVVVDLRRVAEAEREAEALRLATEEARRPFDLERGPLLRVGLLQLSEQAQVLLITTHHIVSDGWSMEIFFRELASLYEAGFHGRGAGLSELPVQYADYAVWQREWLQGEELERQLEYWRRQLGGMEVLRLPTDRPRPGLASYEGSREKLQIDRATTAALKQLSQDENATLFMTLLTGFQMLLARYSGQQDIAVGTLTAGRTRAETEGLIGFFVNTLVLRTDVSGNPTFRELLRRVKETAIGAYGHAELPFEKLVEELQPQRDLSRNPLIQVTFQLFNQHYGGERLIGNAAVPEEIPARMMEVVKGSAKFDMALEIWEAGSGLDGRLEYSTDLFEAATVRRFLECFVRLLHAAARDPDERIEALPLLGEPEWQEQVVRWNLTEREFPLDRSIHELFEEQMAKNPAAPALVCGHEEWNYSQLNQRAEQIAWHLRARGAGPEMTVGVCLARTPQLVAALLGVLKAGTAYVPLDPRYPPDRLEFMVADSGCRLLITDGSSTPLFLRSEVDVVDIREITDQPATTREAARGKLAYVLYTSGSTGMPKGVAIEHRNAASLICWARDFYPAEALRWVLASTSVCFDLSIFEMFAPLCCGGAVVLVDTILELALAPSCKRVTLINTVPSAITELAAERQIPNSVRTVNLAGEPLRSELVDEIFRASEVEEIYNLYGPTEDTTYSTCARIERGERWRPTIGRPIANHTAYLLDRGMMPVPPGVTGELFLGGEGVARGYLNRPGLNSERFLASPFVKGTRLYRTGDLARYREDGEIEFLGRSDSQVKLRGYRIELGEVEAALRAGPGVQDAAVVLREDSGTGSALAAYIVERPGQNLEPAELRRILEQRLPSFMIPSTFTLLERLPLTSNGKLDRQILQAMTHGPLPSMEMRRAAPRTELERSIVSVWKEVLARSDVGLDDNFFELGGHSLLLLRLQRRLAAVTGEVPVVDLFRYPTVAAFAKHLANGSAQESGGLSAVRQRAQRQQERSREREKVLTQKPSGGPPWVGNH